MTAEAPQPAELPDGASQDARRGNGLLADSYVPLTDVAAHDGIALLHALARARIAAYLTDAPPAADSATPPPGAPERLRLFVAAEERADARTIVAAVSRSWRGNGVGTQPGTHGSDEPPDEPGVGGAGPLEEPQDPLSGIDADAEFAALVADSHVDTHQAILEAERALTREDEDWRARLNPPPVDDDPVWLDEDHYVPPAPPPLPRFALPTVLGLVLLLASVALLVAGGYLGLDYRTTLLLGVLGVSGAVAILLSRLRERNDDDDDGAVL